MKVKKTIVLFHHWGPNYLPELSEEEVRYEETLQNAPLIVYWKRSSLLFHTKTPVTYLKKRKSSDGDSVSKGEQKYAHSNTYEWNMTP